MEEIARVITLLILLLQLAVVLRISWRVFREGVRALSHLAILLFPS